MPRVPRLLGPGLPVPVVNALLPPPPRGAAGPFTAPPPQDVPPLAHWHLRAGAALIDGALLLALTAQVYGLAALALGVSEGLALAVLAVGVLALLAFSLQQRLRLSRTGATIGKQLLGLRVVSLRDGRPLPRRDALLRPLAHVPDGILSLGYLLPLVDRRKQTFADKMQRSVVLQVRPEGPRVGVLPLMATAQALVLVAGVGTVGYLLLDEAGVGTAVLEQAGETPLPDAVPAPPPVAAPAPDAAPEAASAPLDPADLYGRIVPPAAGNEFLEGSPDLSLLQTAERLSGAEGEAAEAEAEDLRARGLVSAAVQSFLTPDDRFYEVLVARYDSPRTARAALDYLQQFNGDDAPSTAVPGARVYRFEDEEQSLALGDLAIGSYVYEVSAGADTLEESVELLEAVLAAQARHADATT